MRALNLQVQKEMLNKEQDTAVAETAGCDSSKLTGRKSLCCMMTVKVPITRIKNRRTCNKGLLL